MLQKDLGAQQDQDRTAGDLRLLFEPAAEEVADLYARGRKTEGANSNKQGGQPNIDLTRHCQGNAHRQGIDGCGDGHNEHGLDGKIRVMLLTAVTFL